MRCADLTREIATPTGAYSPDELAGHLAGCQACAEWSRQAARFDQIWDATRPLGPTSTTLDALWASASVALEARPVLRLEGAMSTPRRRWFKPVLVLAQAAALLVAAGYFLNRQARIEPIPVAATDPVGDVSALDFPTITEVVVDDGEIAFVTIPNDSSTPPEVKIVVESTSENSNAIPPGTSHDGFNEMEVKGVKVAGI